MQNEPSNHTPETGTAGNFPTPPGTEHDLAHAASYANPLELIHQAGVSFATIPDGMYNSRQFMDSAGSEGKQALVLLGAGPDYGAAALLLSETLGLVYETDSVSSKTGDICYCGVEFGGCDLVTADLGKIKSVAALRAAAEALARNLSERGYRRVLIALDDFGLELGMRGTLWEMAYGLQMGVYFPSMKTGAGNTKRLEDVTFVLPESHGEAAETTRHAERIIRQASNTALGSQFMRQLVQMPPNVMTTTALYRAALAIAERCPAVKVECTAVREDSDFRLIHAVGRVSNQPSYVITLRYEGRSDAPLQALVGKGLVYDTGGINLKPNGGAGMKADMGGSALVLGTVLAAALNEADANVVAVIGAVCNDIGPDAFRPDDVPTAYNGKTVEIINTDAEGRLVLADCLSYTEQTFSPEKMFSFATLTGAAKMFSGLRAPFFTDDDDLARTMREQAERAEEMIIHVPMDDYLKPTMEDGFADLRNTSSGRECGHTTAAIFLNHFVENTPYCHFDIAGACDLTLERGGGAFGIPMMMAYFNVPLL